MCNRSSIISKLTFVTSFETKFGQNIYMTGEGRVFGNWDVANKGIKLKWNDRKYTYDSDEDSTPAHGRYS